MKKQNREKGTGSIVKKRHHFYLKIRTGGRAKSTLLLGPDDKPVTTRQEAEAAAKLLRPVLRAEQKEEIALHIANAKKMRHEASFPVDQIWKVYLTQYTRPDSGKGTMESYQKSLRHFTKWLAKEHPEVRLTNQITEETAAEYFSYVWTVRKVSGKTFNIYRQALKLIFSHIRVPAGLESNPFDVIESKPVQTESRLPFTEEQVKAIFDGFKTGFFYETEVVRLGPGRIPMRMRKVLPFEPMFKDEMRVLLLLCCWTGCRGQDGCLMEWSNIDLGRRLITYIPRKTARKTGYRKVTLPMKTELYEALLDAVKWKGNNRAREDYILPNVADRYKRNPSGVQKDVMKIIHCATGEETTASKDCLQGQRKLAANVFSLHSFRHTFVSFCANAGVPLAVVAEIVGHGNPAMTEHYSHISTAAKQEAINALPFLQELPAPAETNGAEDDGVIDVMANVVPDEPVDPLAELRQKAIDGIKKAKKRTLQKILSLLG